MNMLIKVRVSNEGEARSFLDALFYSDSVVALGYIPNDTGEDWCGMTVIAYNTCVSAETEEELEFERILETEDVKESSKQLFGEDFVFYNPEFGGE